jgi:hypothetical protein
MPPLVDVQGNVSVSWPATPPHPGARGPIAPRYREDLCLDAAQAIEDRLGILTPIDPR